MSNKINQLPHLLIIDDDPDQLRLLLSSLRSTPYRISVAMNGNQGYARATVLLPDLILLDVCMPGRDGLSVARLLKTNPATQHIPIIFLSAMANENERLSGLRVGAVDYISKPFSVNEVLERTRIHLTLARRLPPSEIDGPKKILPLDSTAEIEMPAANFIFKKMAVEFIFNHINESTLKSSDVASNLGISVRHLNSVFETCDGISTFEFIRQERMRRAALMIGQSTLPIADIAMEVGYPNPANFSTEFRKFWGKSPRQFRNESQSDPGALHRIISNKIN